MVVFVIMIFRLKVVDGLLPVCCQDLALVADEALRYLVGRHGESVIARFRRNVAGYVVSVATRIAYVGECSAIYI